MPKHYANDLLGLIGAKGYADQASFLPEATPTFPASSRPHQGISGRLPDVPAYRRAPASISWTRRCHESVDFDPFTLDNSSLS
jgi:hypothetical protein